MKNLPFFVFSVLFLFACQKEQTSDSLPDEESQFEPQYYVAAINRNMSTFHSIWDSVYQNYPMDVFCACDCNTSSVIQSEVNSRIVHYDGFSEFSAWNFSCEDFMSGIGATCGKEVSYTDSLLSSKLSELLQNNLISQEEYSIIDSLFVKIVSTPENIDFQSYFQDWENLDLDESPTNGLITYTMIEYSRQTFVYFNDFPNPPIDKSEFLVHKLAGGCFGAYNLD